jgi:HEPN domain-containing protein
MSMDKALIKEGLRWLRQAQIDLHWTQFLAEQQAHHLACFLAQQVAEKALQAYLRIRGEEYAPGTPIKELAAAAAAYDPTFELYARPWATLDDYYLAARYPGKGENAIPADEYTESMAREAAALAGQVVACVIEQLG